MEENTTHALLIAVQRHLQRLSRFLVIFGVVIAGLLVALLLRLPTDAGTVPTSATIFERAIEDAAQPRAGDISHALQTITPANAALVWRDDQSWLKVVSWMSERVYQEHYARLVGDPEGGRTPAGKPVIWVTLAPEIQRFCRGLRVDDPSFRLKQRLGLDPNRRYERFVELWVQPQDLFRPCPDPETSDNHCELDFPPGPAPRVKNIEDYPRYFDELVATQYRRDGAPWTRLGYTYDWAYGRRGVGASEFVLAPDVNYRVEASYTTEAYCSP